MDYILASIPFPSPTKSQPTTPPSPPAFLYRRFRTGKETWEILPRLIAEWTLATIPEREPNVARARLCLSIPEGVDRETGSRMRMAFGLWLADGKENEDDENS